MSDELYKKMTPVKEALDCMVEMIKSLGFWCIAGGYPAYLVGLTKTYGDIDIFVNCLKKQLDISLSFEHNKVNWETFPDHNIYYDIFDSQTFAVKKLCHIPTGVQFDVICTLKIANFKSDYARQVSKPKLII